MDLDQQAWAWHAIREEYKVNQTANGPGSTIEFTEPLRDWLPGMLKQYDVYTILDAPCGDQNWIGLVDLSECNYTGWDINPTMLEHNRIRYPDRYFQERNLLNLSDGITQHDLIICRDFLFHLPNEQAAQVVTAFQQSGSRLLLATNHPGLSANDGFDAADMGDGMDDRPGYWYRPINLEVAPFNLTGRIDSVREDDGREMVLFEL